MAKMFLKGKKYPPADVTNRHFWTKRVKYQFNAFLLQWVIKGLLLQLNYTLTVHALSQVNGFSTNNLVIFHFLLLKSVPPPLPTCCRPSCVARQGASRSSSEQRARAVQPTAISASPSSVVQLASNLAPLHRQGTSVEPNSYQLSPREQK